jgi:hypothetical protein
VGQSVLLMPMPLADEPDPRLRGLGGWVSTAPFQIEPGDPQVFRREPRRGDPASSGPTQDSWSHSTHPPSMRDRYLFSADRKTSEYRDVLEVTQGHALLITPSAASRMLRWILSIVYYVLYTGVVGAAWIALALALQGTWFGGWPLEVVSIAGWFVGLIAVGWLADRRSLPLLADSPSEKAELILVGARSFGTFQEVRARTLRGAEIKLIVDAGPQKFWEAVALLEGKVAPSG